MKGGKVDGSVSMDDTEGSVNEVHFRFEGTVEVVVTSGPTDPAPLVIINEPGGLIEGFVDHVHEAFDPFDPVAIDGSRAGMPISVENAGTIVGAVELTPLADTYLGRPGSRLTGGLYLGEGDDEAVFEDDAVIAGNIFGSDDDNRIVLHSGALVDGDIRLGNRNDVLMFERGATLAGIADGGGNLPGTGDLLSLAGYDWAASEPELLAKFTGFESTFGGWTAPDGTTRQDCYAGTCTIDQQTEGTSWTIWPGATGSFTEDSASTNHGVPNIVLKGGNATVWGDVTQEGDDASAVSMLDELDTSLNLVQFGGIGEVEGGAREKRLLTTGRNGAGINNSAEGARVEINVYSLQTEGEGAQGVLNSAGGFQLDLREKGIIGTTGRGAHGVESAGAGAVLRVDGTIEVSGAGANGIRVASLAGEDNRVEVGPAGAVKSLDDAILGGAGDETVILKGAVSGHISLGGGKDEVTRHDAAAVSGVTRGGPGNDRLHFFYLDPDTIDGNAHTGFEYVELDGPGGKLFAGHLEVPESVTAKHGDLVLTEGSRITTGSFLLAADAFLRGSGDIFAGLSELLGTTAAGESFGELVFHGDVTLGTNSVLSIEIGDPDGPLPNRDVFLVNGTLTLDGTLEIDFVDGFLPSEGQRFGLFDGSETVTGAFDEVIALADGALIGAAFDPVTNSLLVETVNAPVPLSGGLLLLASGLAGLWRWWRPVGRDTKRMPCAV